MTINAYLTFNGNCTEAMTFYQKCLGGELFFQTLEHSVLSDGMPEKMRKCIVHSTLKSEQLILMGSDLVSDHGLSRGNAVSLVLSCRSEKEIRACYKKLSEGGQATYPLESSFRGALFGGLTDRFGNEWLLDYNK